MLKEGDIFQFLLYKIIVLPDGETYYLLKSHFNSKHLLQCKIYKNYHFELNQYIACKIDKINCSSRIFLEPEHPIYKINENYKFKFIRFDSIITSKKIQKDAIVLQDKLGSEYICLTNGAKQNFSQQSNVNFKLLRIKKGIFYIQIL